MSPLRSRAASRLKGTAALVVAALIAGCAAPPPPKPTRPVPTRPTPSVGWSGTYRGTVPCGPSSPAAICQSKYVELTLLPGNSYRLETTVRRPGKPYTIVSNGRFRWDDTGTIVTLASKDENMRLRIRNNRAERLPGSNDETDDLNAHRGYVLQKQ
ncbi:MAG: copper resistance protein NlpE N-terminal domain-containing protein [Brachymonas sp.]|nr:copper resistance protein NlpE N-terminal domain-containing protein [Brachymonas sp.]